MTERNFVQVVSERERKVSSLVLPFGITVTYLDGRLAAGVSRLFSILPRRVARSLRVKVH